MRGDTRFPLYLAEPGQGVATPPDGVDNTGERGRGVPGASVHQHHAASVDARAVRVAVLHTVDDAARRCGSSRRPVHGVDGPQALLVPERRDAARHRGVGRAEWRPHQR